MNQAITGFLASVKAVPQRGGGGAVVYMIINRSTTKHVTGRLAVATLYH